MQEYLTTKELEAILKVNRQSIFNYRKQGMPYKKLNRAVRFDLEEVKEWINSNSK